MSSTRFLPTWVRRGLQSVAWATLVACGSSDGMTRQSPTEYVSEAVAQGRQASFAPPSPSLRRAVREYARFARTSPVNPPSPLESTDLGGGLIGMRAPGPGGEGAYLIRRGSGRSLLIEVPHAHFDRHTLPLGFSLFFQLDAGALLVNTTHRSESEGAADAAHAEASVFHEMHRGLMDAHPGALVIAVHGFADRGSWPDIILSDARTGAPTACAATAMENALSDLEPMPQVGRFGVDVHAYGGTTGVQARDLRDRGAAMWHVEIGARLRAALVEDAAMRDELSRSLLPCLPPW